jgi:predicted dehydrogenase
MNQLRFAIFGAGFWSRFQYAAWRELRGVRCVAICDRERAKAEAFAREFDIPAVYDDATRLFANEQLDFVDNITQVEGHKPIVLLAAQHKVPVICQKPMAATLKDARAMVAACRDANVPFFVHENWRWQTPLRAVQKALASGLIGNAWRARITMVSGFAVWENQPALKELEQFILADMGVHLLDAARFLFGEAQSLYCTTKNTRPGFFKGENLATVMTEMNGVTVISEMAYAATPLERECFPQTLVFIEGERGSLELTPDYWVRVTTKNGTQAKRHAPPRYAWADPAYDIAHASLVPCHANLLAALQGKGQAETTGADNLKTLELIYAAYDSARTGKAIQLQHERTQ